MDIGLLVRGVIMGVSIAAPVGPIGVLVIRRTLAEGRRTGFITGLGAATADALYGCVGAFGLTFISTLLLSGQFWTRLIGGLFLCYLGIRIVTASAAERAATVSTASYLRSYLSTLLLTLSNPTTILSFIAIFAGLGVGKAPGDYGTAALLVGGVFIGSALWWLLLSSGVHVTRSRITPRVFRWINRISGTVICGFGVLAVISVL